MVLKLHCQYYSGYNLEGNGEEFYFFGYSPLNICLPQNLKTSPSECNPRRQNPHALLPMSNIRFVDQLYIMTNQDLQNVNDKKMRGKESINIFCFRETKKSVKDDPFALLPECLSV